ncbi:MAG: MFS family permease [Chlamydiales bacterium]|jgi:MFS family permease
MSNTRPRVLGLVFLTVFLDMVGFSIIFPLFPRILEHYVGVEGEHSLIGRFAVWLAEVAGDDLGVRTLFGGILGSIYSLLQFLFAPVWGGLSDRIGRRPTLLITLAGTCLSYVLWFFAGTFGLLILARLLGGIAAGNISTASAVIADTSKGTDRAKGMGMLGAGIGLGFVFGPAIGGLTSGWDLSASWSGAPAGVNPFSGPALCAFVLSLINLLWAAARFPETLPPAAQRGSGEKRRLNPFGALRKLDHPGVRPTNIAYFLYFAGFGAMEFTLTFLAAERLDYTPRDNAWMFVFVGLTIAFVQGGLVRRMVPRTGEKKLALTGFWLTLPGFLLVGFTTTSSMLFVGLFFLASGSACIMPCLSALVSRYSPDEAQGLSLGIFRAMGSLARAISPIVGGLLFWSLGSQAPYIAAAVLLFVPWYLVRGLPPVPE